MQISTAPIAALALVATGASAQTTTVPPTTGASCQNIVEIAAGNPDFETLFAAVDAAGLADALSGEGPLTVFAPTDEAFAALPEGTIDALLADPQGVLTDILTYHVVAGNVLSTDLESGEVETLNGHHVEIEVEDGSVMVNDANVVTADIIACNGVIHVIDAVLTEEEDHDDHDEHDDHDDHEHDKDGNTMASDDHDDHEHDEHGNTMASDDTGDGVADTESGANGLAVGAAPLVAGAALVANWII
ncbi:hypothetical protein ACHAXT_007485 [Thalassiosira profunda]